MCFWRVSRRFKGSSRRFLGLRLGELAQGELSKCLQIKDLRIFINVNSYGFTLYRLIFDRDGGLGEEHFLSIMGERCVLGGGKSWMDGVEKDRDGCDHGAVREPPLQSSDRTMTPCIWLGMITHSSNSTWLYCEASHSQKSATVMPKSLYCISAFTISPNRHSRFCAQNVMK